MKLLADYMHVVLATEEVLGESRRVKGSHRFWCAPTRQLDFDPSSWFLNVHLSFVF